MFEMWYPEISASGIANLIPISQQPDSLMKLFEIGKSFGPMTEQLFLETIVSSKLKMEKRRQTFYLYGDVALTRR